MASNVNFGSEVRELISSRNLRRFDPYWIWAALTNFSGISTRTNEVGSIAPKTAHRRLRLLVELRVSAKDIDFDNPVGTSGAVQRILQSVPSLYWKQPVHFVSTFALIEDAIEVFMLAADGIHPLIKRVELTTAYVDPALAASAPNPRNVDFRVDGDVIAVVDSACPFLHESLLIPGAPAKQLTSRIALLWDQGRVVRKDLDNYFFTPTIRPERDAPWFYGGELQRAHISELLSEAQRSTERDAYRLAKYDAVDSVASHGASVLSLAAQLPIGTMASDASGTNPDIIFVQLPTAATTDASGASLAGYVLDAMHYLRIRTSEKSRVAVTLSLGKHAGPHDGSSLVERALDEFVDWQNGTCDVQPPTGRTFFLAAAAANTFQLAGHASFRLETKQSQNLQTEIFPGNPTWTFIEFWYRQRPARHGDSPDDRKLNVSVLLPIGSGADLKVGPGESKFWPQNDPFKPTLVIVHSPSASETKQRAENACVLLAIAPTVNLDNSYPESPSGTYEIRVGNDDDDEVKVDAWIERGEQLRGVGWGYRQARFVVDEPDRRNMNYPASQPITKFATLNGLATAARVAAIGARYSDEGLNANELTDYTSAGPGRVGQKANGVEATAVVDWSAEFPGLDTAGNTGSSIVRFGGTSAAAPLAARAWLKQNWNPPADSGPTEDLDSQRGRSRPVLG